MDADTVFSLQYNEKENSVTMDIIDGHATIRIGEDEVDLASNETFKHKFKGGTNNAI